MHNASAFMHNTSETCEIGVLLFDTFSNHCLANAIEPLRAANDLARRPLYHWHFLGLNSAPVVSSSGLTVTPTGQLTDHRGDWLLVLPSYDFERHAAPATLRALRAARARFGTLIGLDMGAWLLAAAGLLNGRQATLHWDELDRFAETFPDVDVQPSRMVLDGDMVTCGGATTAFELMLHMIEAQHGAMLRLEVAALFMHGEALTAQTQMPLTETHDVVTAAAALMRRHIEEPLPIAAIARRLDMTPRALERNFARHLGTPPATTYRLLRLNAARRFVEQSRLSVTEIATRTGYETPAALTRAFRRQFGVTPRDMRAKHVTQRSGLPKDPS